jgi:hypothetical protein
MQNCCNEPQINFDICFWIHRYSGRAGNPQYEIFAAFPQLKEWYGILAGPIYSLPYSFFGLVAGKISD